MWLFTKYGFYSAVCARQGDGSRGQPPDPTRVMVRARLRTHLEALLERFGELLVECEIIESRGTDYAYRIFLPQAVWSQVVAGLTDEMDYDNFKSQVQAYQRGRDAAYEHALHEVWSVMHRLQK